MIDDFGWNPADGLWTSDACVACHQVDPRMVGPSFKEVAAKSAGDSTAAGRFAKKIKDGGAGNWGSVPMPPHPQLSDVDLNLIVGWALEQK